MSQKYAGAARKARAPKQPLPPMSCDCHLHVFGDPARYPDRHPNPVLNRGSHWEDALAMHRAAGFGRVCSCSSKLCGPITPTSRSAGRVPRANYRATGIIDDSVSDAELLRLHEAACAAHGSTFVRTFNMAPSPESFRRSSSIRPYGWYAKLFMRRRRNSPTMSRRSAPSRRRS